jgi:hypothetical protein
VVRHQDGGCRAAARTAATGQAESLDGKAEGVLDHPKPTSGSAAENARRLQDALSLSVTDVGVGGVIAHAEERAPMPPPPGQMVHAMLAFGRVPGGTQSELSRFPCGRDHLT